MSGGIDSRFKFTEKERDVETGYDSFGARHYDSRLGRWFGVDPSAIAYPNLSPYVYAANVPLYYTDPNGRWIVRQSGLQWAGSWSIQRTTAAGQILNSWIPGDPYVRRMLSKDPTTIPSDADYAEYWVGFAMKRLSPWVVADEAASVMTALVKHSDEIHSLSSSAIDLLGTSGSDTFLDAAVIQVAQAVGLGQAYSDGLSETLQLFTSATGQWTEQEVNEAAWRLTTAISNVASTNGFDLTKGGDRRRYARFLYLNQGKLKKFFLNEWYGEKEEVEETQ